MNVTTRRYQTANAALRRDRGVLPRDYILKHQA